MNSIFSWDLGPDPIGRLAAIMQKTAAAKHKQTKQKNCLKNCAKFRLSELRQISANFDNVWHEDGKESKIMRGALISTSHNLRHHTKVLNADVRNCYITL